LEERRFSAALPVQNEMRPVGAGAKKAR